MGVDIDDQELAMAVLNGLPERFDSLICAFDVLENESDTFTLEFVKSRLLREEQRMKVRMEATHVKYEASALVTPSRRIRSASIAVGRIGAGKSSPNWLRLGCKGAGT